MPYGKVMAKLWQSYGKVLWQSYGEVMARLWQSYGKVMAIAID